jgi:hypothetical protein
MNGDNGLTPEEEIKRKYDQQAEDFHWDQKTAAEDYTDLSPVRDLPPRKYTSLDREIYLKAKAEHQEAFLAYKEAIADDIRSGTWRSWSGPLYRKVQALQEKLFEISKKHGVHT